MAKIRVKPQQKRVRIWSTRKQRHVTIAIDYARAEVGDLTFIQLLRFRDSSGHDSAEVHAPTFRVYN